MKHKSRSSTGIFSEQVHPSFGEWVQALYPPHRARSLLQLPLTAARTVSQNLIGLGCYLAPQERALLASELP